MHPVPADKHSEIKDATGGFSRIKYERIFRSET